MLKVLVSHVRLFVTLWTVVCQALLSMGILQTRILEWVPFSTQGDLPAGIEPGSPALQGDPLSSKPLEKP